MFFGAYTKIICDWAQLKTNLSQEINLGKLSKAFDINLWLTNVVNKMYSIGEIRFYSKLY